MAVHDGKYASGSVAVHDCKYASGLMAVHNGKYASGLVAVHDCNCGPVARIFHELYYSLGAGKQAILRACAARAAAPTG